MRNEKKKRKGNRVRSYEHYTILKRPYACMIHRIEEETRGIEEYTLQ